ncbi:hypothetical protein ATCC90586_009385 [Pythium insidiosum]|nr:hypothetical protein ATCC90586_009385 [Pythium insidiosum]
MITPLDTIAEVERQTEPEGESELDDNHGKIMEDHGSVVDEAKPTIQDSSTTTEDKSTPDAVAVPEIHLNPRAAKTGRPKLDKQVRGSEEKQQRIVFRASQDAKTSLGEVTLKGFLDALLDEKPPVEEALRRLEVIPIKFADAESKKPKLSTQKNAVVILDAFYLLSVKLLRSCVAKVPTSNRAEDAISAVRYYDSLNNRSYKSALDKMSKDIIERVAPTYSVISLNSPIQFDSYSCGLFVCFKMWRRVDSNISTNMSDYGLGARRFELLRYVFEYVGSQIKQGTETES